MENPKLKEARGKLSKAQAERLMYCYKDGVRSYNQLSITQEEALYKMKIYEDMDSDIDRLLGYYKENGY
jgi:hypothetical protein